MVFGSLLARLGLEGTLRVVPITLLVGAAVAFGCASYRPRIWRIGAGVALLGVAATAGFAPTTWDRELLASGVYKYSRDIPSDLNVGQLLKVGTLRYYRDGQLATISVKEFAGRTSLAIDGKVDGSTGGDMLTQELAAHVPLLLHERPGDVLVVGLGTGVTVASAASHPVANIDVVEISPEVVEASSLFVEQNRRVLADPRVRLLVGDARSHIGLSTKRYDVVISEPSNPWLAGVAALFTQEAFKGLRNRLAPGGIACQWVHTYDMSEADFRSIVATFLVVFPAATLWTVGETDILLVSGERPLDEHLAHVEPAWTARNAAREDLARVGVRNPFGVLSLWAGGPRTLARLGGNAPLQRDDRMALEFSAPRAVFQNTGSNQAPLVRSALQDADVPPMVRRALETASPVQWVQRAVMFEKMRLFKAAYADYAKALNLNPTMSEALSGIAVVAAPAGEQSDALARFTTARSREPDSVAIAIAYSRLKASLGHTEAAIFAAAAAAGTSRIDYQPWNTSLRCLRMPETSSDWNGSSGIWSARSPTPQPPCITPRISASCKTGRPKP